MLKLNYYLTQLLASFQFQSKPKASKDSGSAPSVTKSSAVAQAFGEDSDEVGVAASWSCSLCVLCTVRMD